MAEKIEITFPDYLVNALTKAHENFGIDIEEYIVETVEGDIKASETGNDTMLNKFIRENMAEVAQALKIEES